MEYGANIEARSAAGDDIDMVGGMTAMHLAVSHGIRSIVRRLIEMGADVNAKDDTP